MNTISAQSRKTKKLPKFCLGVYLLSAISAFLYAAFALSPAFADWFNQSISHYGRFALAAVSSWVPFSVAELLLLLLPLLLVILIVVAYRHFCSTARECLVFIGILLSGAGVVWCLFVWNFAPGYYGTTLDQKLELDREKVSAEELYKTSLILSEQLKELKEEVTFLPDGSSLMPYSYREMNEKILDAYDAFAAKNEFLKTYDSAVKPVMMSEAMSYTHITGIYSFFTGESNINVDFPDYTVPYTAAHELAHQRGVAREDEANFVAYLVCMESDDPYLRYSATLNLYEYVSASLYTADAEKYTEINNTLPMAVKKERAAYARFFEKYRESVAADISNATNDTFLKLNGSEAGSQSYNLVTDLAVAYWKPYFD